MAGERAAIRYAKALLSLSEEKKASEDINKDMTLIAESISKSKDLRLVLESPVVQSSKKQSAILAIFKDINALTVNMVDILNTNKRIKILGEVANQYMRLYDELKGIQVATVTTAVTLDDLMRAKVLAKVKELTGKQAEVTNKIDESIVGGYILRVGDIQYDASIANKLNTLKREFTLN